MNKDLKNDFYKLPDELLEVTLAATGNFKTSVTIPV